LQRGQWRPSAKPQSNCSRLQCISKLREEDNKGAKERFDDDADFKNTAQLNAVKLQSGDEECRKVWKILSDISRHTTNQKFQIVPFFCYLDPNGPSYLAPTLFDTPSLSYLTPTLFGPKSSYLAPAPALFDTLSLSFSHLRYLAPNRSIWLPASTNC
jgi:hypothetical protein